MSYPKHTRGGGSAFEQLDRLELTNMCGLGVLLMIAVTGTSQMSQKVCYHF